MSEGALQQREAKRAEAAAALERRMAAMEAAMAARRTPIAEAQPEAARGPGAELRFQVSLKSCLLFLSCGNWRNDSDLMTHFRCQLPWEWQNREKRGLKSKSVTTLSGMCT